MKTTTDRNETRRTSLTNDSWTFSQCRANNQHINTETAFEENISKHRKSHAPSPIVIYKSMPQKPWQTNQKKAIRYSSTCSCFRKIKQKAATGIRIVSSNRIAEGLTNNSEKQICTSDVCVSARNTPKSKPLKETSKKTGNATLLTKTNREKE